MGGATGRAEWLGLMGISWFYGTGISKVMVRHTM
jgi:hypothetical protein